MLQPKRGQESPQLQAAKENDLFPEETSTGMNLQLYTGGALGEMALHVAVLWDGLEAAMVLVKEPDQGEPSVGRTARDCSAHGRREPERELDGSPACPQGQHLYRSHRHSFPSQLLQPHLLWRAPIVLGCL